MLSAAVCMTIRLRKGVPGWPMDVNISALPHTLLNACSM